MPEQLTPEDVTTLLDKLRKIVEKDDCWTCDCLQGFLTQLELDATEEAAALIAPLKVSGDRMHLCLGCAPCIPGAAFADYVREKMT